jgi:hypothetical protein
MTPYHELFHLNCWCDSLMYKKILSLIYDCHSHFRKIYIIACWFSAHPCSIGPPVFPLNLKCHFIILLQLLMSLSNKYLLHSMCQIPCLFSFAWAVSKNPSKSETLWNISKHNVVTVRSCKPHTQHTSWRTAPRRLSMTAYSIYSQPPSVHGGRIFHPQPEDASMQCWQETHITENFSVADYREN